MFATIHLTVSTAPRTAEPESNQDAIAVDGWLLRPESGSTLQLGLDARRPRAIVVADGLGGHAGGAEAATMVARDVSAAPAAEHPAAIARAHERLARMAAEQPDLHGLGSTVVALGWSPNGQLRVASVGDTVAYRVVDGVLGRLSVADRSGHALSRCVGGGKAAPPRAALRTIVVSPGTRVLVLTDGVWDGVPLDDLEACASIEDAGAGAAAFLELVSRRGSSDDATALFLDFDGPAA